MYLLLTTCVSPHISLRGGSQFGRRLGGQWSVVFGHLAQRVGRNDYTATSMSCHALNIAATFRPYRIGLVPVVGYFYVKMWQRVSPMHGWEARGQCEWPKVPRPACAIENGIWLCLPRLVAFRQCNMRAAEHNVPVVDYVCITTHLTSWWSFI